MILFGLRHLDHALVVGQFVLLDPTLLAPCLLLGLLELLAPVLLTADSVSDEASSN